MDNELSNTFFEVQAEKFYQKKVEVARGVIELGQILKETREGLNNYKLFEQWLEDERVKFGRRMANKYIRIYEELGTTNSQVFDSVSINKLYSLASAPEEVKEDVANSKRTKIPPLVVLARDSVKSFDYNLYKTMLQRIGY